MKTATFAIPSPSLVRSYPTFDTHIVCQTHSEQISAFFESSGDLHCSMSFDTIKLSCDSSLITCAVLYDMSTSTVTFTDDNRNKYLDVFSAIDELSNLDESDNRFINNDTAQAARHFASLLNLYNVAVPQIFPHGGDALVFKWSVEDSDTYVTIGDDDSVSLRTYHRGTPTSPIMNFSKTRDIVPLMLQLGGEPWRTVQMK